MRLDRDSIVSAQVLLRPAGGGRAPEIVTSTNVHESLPSRENVASASRHFADAGFSIGSAVANSFSITGRVPDFEKAFGVTLRSRPGGGVEAVDKSGAGGLELPLGRLPPGIARMIEAITFTPPPDFGPTDR